MAALIPGLEIQVEGTYDGQNQLVAKLVKFQGNDLERAQSIQAGRHVTEAQAQRNREVQRVSACSLTSDRLKSSLVQVSKPAHAGMAPKCGRPTGSHRVAAQIKVLSGEGLARAILARPGWSRRIYSLIPWM